MKLIVAIVRSHTIDRIVCALEDIENFPGITVSDAEGVGQRLRTTSYDALSPFKEKKRIEIAFSFLPVTRRTNLLCHIKV